MPIKEKPLIRPFPQGLSSFVRFVSLTLKIAGDVTAIQTKVKGVRLIEHL